MTPLSPEALELVRELRGIVPVAARLRFCASLLARRDVPLENRLEVTIRILIALSGEIDAASVRIKQPRPVRALELLEQIGQLSSGRIHVRNDRLAKVYRLAREARRLLRSA